MSAADAENEVLARIRRGSANASAARIEKARNALARAPRPAVPRGEERIELLLSRLRTNGCSAVAVANRSAAIAEIARFVAARHSQRRVVTGQDPRLAALPWRDGGLLPRFGTASADDRISVSYAVSAIVETGSLVLWNDKRNPALNNLLVTQQIILVDEESVRDSLESLWESAALSSAPSRPRGIMMISGPSSTADIAMQLVWGAHGPQALHAIVLRQRR